MQAFKKLGHHLLTVTLWLACVEVLAASCTPVIEEHPAWTSASLRPHDSAFLHCVIDEDQYQKLISEWLHARASTAPALTSLSLGRVVHLPWISSFIADTALQTPGWATRIAHAKTRQREKLALPILQHPALLQRLAAPFMTTDYEVLGISYEKLLFGNANTHSSNPAASTIKVPYDAQLWLRLGKRKKPEPDK